MKGESSLKLEAEELNKDNNEGMMDLEAHIPELEGLPKANDLSLLNLSRQKEESVVLIQAEIAMIKI